jgi:hypothetical protein
VIAYVCGFCGRPCANFVWLNGSAYHEECTHGPHWQPRYYGTAQPAPALTEEGVRQIVREEIERLKDQIEHGLGVRP